MESYDYDHLEDIVSEFEDIATELYEQSRESMESSYWLERDILDKAIDNAVNQVIYLLTLKHQQERRSYK